MKTHAQHLKEAKIDDRDIPPSTQFSSMRRTAYVVPPEDSDSENESVDGSKKEGTESRQIKINRKERENSDDEDDIPLMELAKRIRARDAPESDEEETVDPVQSEQLDHNDQEVRESQDVEMEDPIDFSGQPDEEMSINAEHHKDVLSSNLNHIPPKVHTDHRKDQSFNPKVTSEDNITDTNDPIDNNKTNVD